MSKLSVLVVCAALTASHRTQVDLAVVSNSSTAGTSSTATNSAPQTAQSLSGQPTQSVAPTSHSHLAANAGAIAGGIGGGILVVAAAFTFIFCRRKKTRPGRIGRMSNPYDPDPMTREPFNATPNVSMPSNGRLVQQSSNQSMLARISGTTFSTPGEQDIASTSREVTSPSSDSDLRGRVQQLMEVIAKLQRRTSFQGSDVPPPEYPGENDDDTAPEVPGHRYVHSPTV